MKRLCPSSCDFCYGEPSRPWPWLPGLAVALMACPCRAEFPFPTEATTPPPPRTKTRLVPEGRNMTFRCGQKILHKKGKVQ